MIQAYTQGFTITIRCLLTVMRHLIIEIAIGGIKEIKNITLLWLHGTKQRLQLDTD